MKAQAHAAPSNRSAPVPSPMPSSCLPRTRGQYGSSDLLGAHENGANQTLLNQRLLTKLVVGASNDPLEHEADRVADQILRMPEPDARQQRDGKPAQSKPLVQRKSIANEGDVVEPPPSVHQLLRAPGHPLGTTEREYFERRFGHDFSRVRVHSGALAGDSTRALQARAYTVGDNIAFAEGQYSPGTAEGKRLLAHELVHVVQNSGHVQGEEHGGSTTSHAIGMPGPAQHAPHALPSLSAQPTGVLRRTGILDRISDAIDPRTRQFMSDLVASVREAPSHILEFVTGDLITSIRENIGQIVLVTLGLLAIQGTIAALAVTPTGVTQIISAILEIAVLAILGYFAAVEVGAVAEEGQSWWAAAREANGNPSGISEASRAFVRMVWHIFMIVLIVAGVRARVRSGAVSRITAPLRGAPTPPVVLPPTSAPSTRPPLRSISGGNPEPIRIENGRVVSSRAPTSSSEPRGGSSLTSRGGAAPALAPEPVIEPEPPAPRPPLRVVPDAPTSSATTPSTTGAIRPGVQPIPATATGVARATQRRRRHPSAYPILWPVVFGPPALFGAPIVLFTRTPNAERDETFLPEVRRELWARTRGDPDLMPSDYHAHHIVPLFLGGLDQARGNIMFLNGELHLQAHRALQNQPQMMTPPPPLAPLPANILRHPAGTMYELVGFK